MGTYRETNSHATRWGMLGQSSQLAEPLLTDPGISGISVHKLVSTEEKKEKKAQAGNELLNTFPKSLQARKKSPSSQIREWGSLKEELLG